MKLAGIAKVIRKTLALAVVLTAVCSASPAHARGWGGWGGFGGSKGGGGSSGGGASGVPEIDAGSAAAAVTVLVGGVLMLRDRFGLRRKDDKSQNG